MKHKKTLDHNHPDHRAMKKAMQVEIGRVQPSNYAGDPPQNSFGEDADGDGDCPPAGTASYGGGGYGRGAM